MKAFAVKTSIHATPEQIWALLINAPNYPVWNNTVNSVEGKIALGEKVTVHPKINPRRAFPVVVAEFQAPRKMVWTGGMPLSLFKGERTFSITPTTNGDVDFSMREEYTGLMAPLIGLSIPDLTPAFNEFANDLKRAAGAQ